MAAKMAPDHTGAIVSQPSLHQPVTGLLARKNWRESYSAFHLSPIHTLDFSQGTPSGRQRARSRCGCADVNLAVVTPHFGS